MLSLCVALEKNAWLALLTVIIGIDAEWFAILAAVWNGPGAITSPADAAEAVRLR